MGQIVELVSENDKEKIMNWLRDYETFKTEHKTIVNILAETKTKLPFVDFLQLCNYIEV